MTLMEKPLEKLAKIQSKYGLIILVLIFIFTIFISFGIKNIQLESDMNEQMPQDLPIFKLNDRIRSTFSGQDTIFILFMLDEQSEIKDVPKDILSPEIMGYTAKLHKSLEKESQIDQITSLGPAVGQAKKYSSNLTTESITKILDYSPELWSLVSNDRKKMIMILNANIGNSESDINSINNMIQNKIEGFSTPPGTNILITGTPPLQATILDLLRYDSVFTLALAFAIIFLLLIIMQRSLKKSAIISIPLLFGILWTGGSLGWLNIKISFATAGLGAMLLGLGVEYGVFMLTRYKEERDKKNKNPAKAMRIAVPSVGSAIVGSGTTTIIGFLALTLSIIPMMQNLGISLAMGIFYCIIAAVVIEPIIILYLEKLGVNLK
ncbi:MAG: MMPL family transporter [Nanobdellota archaeon]